MERCLPCGQNTEDSVRNHTLCQCIHKPLLYHRFKHENKMSDKPCYCKF